MSTTAPVSTPSLASALEARRDTLQLSDQDRALLLETVDRVAPHWPAFLDRLYERLGRHPETSILLQNPEVVTRLKAHQLAYLRTLFTSAHDDEHASQLIRLGHTHYRMRVTPDWYISTYAHFLCDHIDLIADHELLSSNSIAVTNALIRSVFYDIALVLDAYGAGEAEAVSRRHAELVRPPSAAPAPMNLRPTPPPLPPSVPTSTLLRVSGARVTERKTFLGIDAEAGDALARIQPQLAATIPTILSDFYDLSPPSRTSPTSCR